MAGRRRIRGSSCSLCCLPSLIGIFTHQVLSVVVPLQEQTDLFFLLCPKEQETLRELPTLVLESKANIGQ